MRGRLTVSGNKSQGSLSVSKKPFDIGSRSVMGMKQSGGRACARQVESLSNISTFSSGARISRDFLLAGASLVALSAFAAPDRALAACSGPNQTISTPTTGSVYSNGGAVTVTKAGSVTSPSGVNGLPGVDVTVCPTTTLTNRGTIAGGAGSAPSGTAFGGAGVSNSGKITTLTNSGTISGGDASANSSKAVGGAGVSNAGKITTLTNSGAIAGGAGSAPSGTAFG